MVTKASYPPITGERVFADDSGRLWTAANSGEILVFTCISDGRNAGRAIDIADVTAPSHYDALDDTIGDETLRAWLNAAPRIGTLP